jgi:hypothetical protein
MDANDSYSIAAKKSAHRMLLVVPYKHANVVTNYEYIPYLTYDYKNGMTTNGGKISNYVSMKQ